MKKRLISSGVTIADVAEAAGVSVSLVSFVLNAKRGPDGVLHQGLRQKKSSKPLQDSATIRIWRRPLCARVTARHSA